ncbi:hypothetical protein HOE04_02290 [archaeon]|mgnify:FL=1|jgi:hypothetical protein|nr:hypothetical protein [archaeon]
MKLRLLVCLVVFLGVVLVGSLVDGAEFKLNNVSPNQEVVSFFGEESQSLSIGSASYESVKWYLDGKLVKEDVNSFVLKDLDSAIYIVRVDVIDGTDVDSKTWNIVIKEEQIVKERGLDRLEVIYYVYVSVLLIVILLVVRLFIIEKRKNK